MRTPKTTAEDAVLRAGVVDLIMAELADRNSRVYVPNGWAEFVRPHRGVMIGLFGGQGVQALGRVVAWVLREVTGKRRANPEAACLLVDLLGTGQLDQVAADIAVYIRDIDGLIRYMLSDRRVAEILLQPVPTDRHDLDALHRRLLDLLGRVER